MKISERPATKAAPATAIDGGLRATASPTSPPSATRTPPHEWGGDALMSAARTPPHEGGGVFAPRYARYTGTRGRTHGETNDARPARKASAGLTLLSTRSPTAAPAPRSRRRSAATRVSAGRGPCP